MNTARNLLLLGRPVHYGNPAACGLVGKFPHTYERIDVSCLSCKRTHKFRARGKPEMERLHKVKRLCEDLQKEVDSMDKDAYQGQRIVQSLGKIRESLLLITEELIMRTWDDGR